MTAQLAPAAVVGIGETDYSTRSGRSELELAGEAVLNALADAGRAPESVDGLIRFGASQRGASEFAVAQALGLGSLRYWGSVDLGGGASAALVGHAQMALATGAARCVVGYRALNGRSGARPGTSETSTAIEDLDPNYRDFLIPHGLTSPIQMYALMARRYVHDHGIDPELFGGVAVALREYANANPRAQMHGRSLSMSDYLASELITTPLRKLDCCLQTDGAAAFVMVGAAEAKDQRRPPVYVKAAVQASMPGQPGYLYSAVANGDLLRTPAANAATVLFGRAGIVAADIDVAQLYDCFSITMILQLEGYGFCAPGEAAERIAKGVIGLGGEIPANTAGGSFGEAYIHGVNHVLEGVRQIRGDSTSQVPDAKLCLVTGGIPVPTSAVILSADR